jgi:hypothetical protein
VRAPIAPQLLAREKYDTIVGTKVSADLNPTGINGLGEVNNEDAMFAL